MGFFGDSLTNARPGYVAGVASALGKTYRRDAYGGRRSYQLLTELPSTMIRPFKQAVVMIGVNDCQEERNPALILADIAAIWQAMPGVPHPVTIAPAGNFATWNPTREAIRLAVNAGLKSTHPNVTDLDPVLGEGSNPVVLRAEYELPDRIHWSTAGHDAARDAIVQQGGL